MAETLTCKSKVRYVMQCFGGAGKVREDGADACTGCGKDNWDADEQRERQSLREGSAGLVQYLEFLNMMTLQQREMLQRFLRQPRRGVPSVSQAFRKPWWSPW